VVAVRAQHRRRRLGRPAPAELAAQARRGQRAVRLAVPQHRDLRAAQPRLRAAQPAVAANRTVETAVLLSHPESADDPDAEAGLDQLEKFWDLVNRQDLEIVERVQQGIADPAYRGGRMCFRFEEPLHRFQNMVIDRMVGLDRIPDGDDEPTTRMFPDPLGIVRDE
jgi:hypothetical protein